MHCAPKNQNRDPTDPQYFSHSTKTRVATQFVCVTISFFVAFPPFFGLSCARLHKLFLCFPGLGLCDQIESQGCTSVGETSTYESRDKQSRSDTSDLPCLYKRLFLSLFRHRLIAFLLESASKWKPQISLSIALPSPPYLYSTLCLFT